VWNLLQLCLSDDYIENNKTNDKPLKEKTNDTIKNVTNNIDAFHYNKSIANLYELINFIQKTISNKSSSKNCLKESFKNLALLLQPFIPHLSEEIWESLGLDGLAINQLWPKSLTTQTKKICNIAIQIDGKTREIIEFDVGIDEERVKTKALNSKKIKKMTDKKTIKKTIFVPEKILNIVLK
jgi:leucyl-tRNA synthetase